MQHRRECHFRVAALSQCLKVAPSTNGGEAPGLETLQSGAGPHVRIRIMLPCHVPRVRGIELLARSALADATDAEGKEPLAVGPDEPRSVVLLLNRKRRVERKTFGCHAGSAYARSEHEHGHGDEGGILQQLVKRGFQVAHFGAGSSSLAPRKTWPVPDSIMR